MFHAFLSGTVAALLLSLGIIYLHENASAKTAAFRGNGWGEQPAPSRVNPPPTDPVTSTDSDGDGIPNTWETANAHKPNNPADAASDFDFDGLTAKQEYELSVRPGGLYGKPLGTYEVATIPDPQGYTTISTITLIDAAKNGTSLVRVVGVRSDATTSSTRVYTYSPATGRWTWVVPPASVASTSVLTATDVNSRGQVVGYLTTGGTKGFIWTPSPSHPDGGESKQFFINPTATPPTSAFPRRISDTGHLLYTTGSPTSTDLKPADPKQVPINPLTPPTNAGTWTSPVYVDVNDFGEYVGTIVNPLTGLRHTFLALPGGYFHLSTPVTADVVNNRLINMPDVPESSIQWQPIPTFTYPDDYYDENGYSVDPWEPYYSYDAYGQTSTIMQYGSAMIGGFEQLYRRDTATGLIYWNQYYYGDDRSWYAVKSSVGAPIALNDWGEFGGAYTFTLANETVNHNYSTGGTDHYYYEDTPTGAFFYNGDYHLTNSSQQVVGMSNDPQMLLGYSGIATHLWSDSVIAPLTKLLPAGSTNPQKTKICDNGLLIIQKTSKILQTIIPADDTDGDGIPDDWEAFYNLNPAVNDGHLDTDGDGTSNLAEFYLRSDPNAAPVIDPNNGQTIDVRDGIDTDGDGMPNIWEIANGLDYNNPADAALDYDRDGYTNLQEFRLNTDPQGAPFYRVRELGPFPDPATVSLYSGVLGEEPVASTPGDSLYLRGRASNNASVPAVWDVQRGAGQGTYTLYKGNVLGNSTTIATTAIAQGVNGAALGLAPTSPRSILYWSSPTAYPVIMSGAANANDLFGIVGKWSLSPSGKYAAGSRAPTSNTSLRQWVIWKMPENGVISPPVILPLPTGASISSTAVPYLTDHGHVAVNATISGQKRVILWKLNTAGTAVTTTLLLNLSGSSGATAVGISNSTDPVIAGTTTVSSNPARAVIWKSDGVAVNLGTLSGGTTASVGAVSPSGLVAGTSETSVNGVIRNQPFTASYNTTTSAWVLKAVGNPEYACTIQKVLDSGELYGEVTTSSQLRPVSTLWRRGKAYPLGQIVPVSSGHAFTRIISANQNGALHVNATRNGTTAHLLLTPDRDTDGDGIPDTYETENGLNPFSANTGDTDGDGLSDTAEYQNGTLVNDPDTDGDGMQDGWEVRWGLLPLDPSDAALDNDGDHVSNLDESKISTSPVNNYLIRQLPLLGGEYSKSFADDGSFLKTTLAGAATLVGGAQEGSTPTLTPLPPGGFSYYYDSSSVYHEITEDVDNRNAGGGVVNAFAIRTHTVAGNSQVDYLLIPDRLNTADARISLADIVDDLILDQHLAPGDDLLPTTIASPTGNARIFQAALDQVILSQNGTYKGTLSGNYDWVAINNKGQAVALVITPVTASGTTTYDSDLVLSDGTTTQTLRVSTGDSGPYEISFIAVDDKGEVTYNRNLPDPTGTANLVTTPHVASFATNSIRKARYTGMTNEYVLTVSSENGRMLGDGPEPFKIEADGAYTTLATLPVYPAGSDPATAATVPFATIHSTSASALLPIHISSGGIISSHSYSALGIVQLIPNTDTDADGIPDDWEKNYAQWLYTSGQTPTLLTNVNPSSGNTQYGLNMVEDYQNSHGSGQNAGSGNQAGDTPKYSVKLRRASAYHSSGYPGLYDPTTAPNYDPNVIAEVPVCYLKKTETKIYDSGDDTDTDNDTESEDYNYTKESQWTVTEPGESDITTFEMPGFYQHEATIHWEETVSTWGHHNESWELKTPPSGSGGYLKSKTTAALKTATAQGTTTTTEVWGNTPSAGQETTKTDPPSSWSPYFDNFPTWINNDASKDDEQSHTSTGYEHKIVLGRPLTHEERISDVRSYLARNFNSLPWPAQAYEPTHLDQLITGRIFSKGYTGPYEDVEDIKIEVTASKTNPEVVYIARTRTPDMDTEIGVTNSIEIIIVPAGETRTIYKVAEAGENEVVQVRISGSRLGGPNVDTNRDGYLSYDESKATVAKPFRFWINNDNDEDEDSEDPEFGTNDRDWLDNQIKTNRDLEDFTRLNLNTGFSTRDLVSGEIKVGLKFTEIKSGKPRIKVWPNQDPWGSLSYLNNGTAATRQRSEACFTSSDGLVQIPPSFWSHRSDSTANFIFEGESVGLGKLAMVVMNKNGTKIGESAGTWINLLDVRNMYRRARIQNEAEQIPQPWVSTNPPAQTWTWDPYNWPYSPDPDAEPVSMVYVHGWNNTYNYSMQNSQTSFKRLWHQGFKGDFYAFRWATFSGADGVLTYNPSEYRAWLCGPAMAQFVNGLPYPARRCIFAHSMGNVVVGSALRAGMQVKNYSMCNAAMSAMAYDNNTALRYDPGTSEFLGYIFPSGSAQECPDLDPSPTFRDTYGLKDKFHNVAGAPNFFNFGLPNDSALGNWVANNHLYKPDLIHGYSYRAAPTGSFPYKMTRDTGPTKVEVTNVAEAFGFVTKSLTRTAGSDLRTRGAVFAHQNMDDWGEGVAHGGFGSTHSAEWQWNYQSTSLFWEKLVIKLEAK
ncbi:alpha/beta hydrolase [Luteolibacter yonseiensis]|uniref:Alpha/beta hydrolase n=2 Tax=Luteolibacter yonseiensis TaxID=1144680 RepID=A0A934VAF1_9BACT|nr:alpha/beta hydrolase [Luteolibacter yonseiensis]